MAFVAKVVAKVVAKGGPLVIYIVHSHTSDRIQAQICMFELSEVTMFCLRSPWSQRKLPEANLSEQIQLILRGAFRRRG